LRSEESYPKKWTYEALAKLRARREFSRFLMIFECPRPVGDRFPIC
jgi:hypothetical protein